jgi:YegS/Rv2252/BmrU family lipid kinase
VSQNYLAVVNPAAGGGRAGRMVGGALERLRSYGIAVDVAETAREGHATELTRDAYARGYRKFISVGGDGTTFEIVNGLFPEAASGDPPILAFLPLGTGNSFLRDFTNDASSEAVEALIEGRLRPCDVFRLRHKTGAAYFLNLFNVGFAADVAMIRHRRFRRFGELGYIFALFVTLARLDRRAFPMSVDSGAEVDRRRSLFLTFNNSKFTGGKMMIAPNAETNDGLIEYVRWGPIGRLGLIGNLPGLFTGKHIHHPMAERKSVQRVDFFLDRPVDVALDGEVATLHIEGIDVLPQALRVVI